jgi:hypothetical protein
MKNVSRTLIQAITVWVAVFQPAVAQDARPTTPAAARTSISIPRGTIVRVSITDELDGYRNLAGSKIHFTTLDPVVVDGKTIVEKNDIGEGTIQDGGHGLLRISVDRIYTFCGDTLDMLFEFAAADRRRAFASGAPSQIHKGTAFLPATLHVQNACSRS